MLWLHSILSRKRRHNAALNKCVVALSAIAYRDALPMFALLQSQGEKLGVERIATDFANHIVCKLPGAAFGIGSKRAIACRISTAIVERVRNGGMTDYEKAIAEMESKADFIKMRQLTEI